jgi:hypothetical protein
MRPLAIFALLTVLTPWAAAQRTSTAHAAAPRLASPRLKSPTPSFALGQSGHPSGFRRSSPHTSLPFPFFGDFSDLDDLYSTGYPVASQPPMMLLEAARTLTGSSEYLTQARNGRESPSTQPLMIELQNGRYVRVTSTPANGEALTLEPSHAQPKQAQPNSDQRAKQKTRPNSPAASNSIPETPASNLPPAILVFRDGHSEEVRDYAIADGVLYARGDYYTDGYWNKKIALSTLNVAETLEANTTRQVKFVLPTSPNEVITRP